VISFGYKMMPEDHGPSGWFAMWLVPSRPASISNRVSDPVITGRYHGFDPRFRLP
jgi:hypothetical protein